MNKIKKIGFWTKKGETFAGTDKPIENTMPWETVYNELPVENSSTRTVEETLEWCEKLKNVQYYCSRIITTNYLGSSPCRICDRSNGGSQYNLGDYNWPSGYGHYVKYHNIEVPNNFWDFIKNHEIVPVECKITGLLMCSPPKPSCQRKDDHDCISEKEWYRIRRTSL